MRELAGKSLLRLGRALPGLKSAVPDCVMRFLFLHVVRRDETVRIRERKSRIWLEDVALPALVRTGDRVLFVGVAPYTWKVLRKLRRRGAVVTTIDVNPAASLWGTPRHVVGSVLDPPAELLREPFDLVCCNGLIGYGIDTAGDLVRLAAAMRRLAGEGGILMIGWHYARTSLDPGDVFKAPEAPAADELPLPPFVEFTDEQERFLIVKTGRRG